MYFFFLFKDDREILSVVCSLDNNGGVFLTVGKLL